MPSIESSAKFNSDENESAGALPEKKMLNRTNAKVAFAIPETAKYNGLETRSSSDATIVIAAEGAANTIATSVSGMMAAIANSDR